MNPQADSWSDTKIVAVEFDAFFDGAKIAECNTFNHVVSSDREHVLNRVEPLKLTTNTNSVFGRSRTAEFITTQC